MDVSLVDIGKTFRGAVPAVRDLNLEIRGGEFLTLLGSSGCGKSTTLRMIAGLEFPSHGRILFDTRDVTDLNPSRRNVAMVFQNYALYPHMTVAQNIAYPLRKRGVRRDQRARRVADMAGSLHLEGLLERYPKQLSGGQQQRVALARALVREPDLFLLDEPLSNLDAALRAQLRMEIKRLHLENGSTMIYVTHDQGEAMSMSDRIAVVDRGVLQQIGTSEDVYHRPRNMTVALFVGSPAMNAIPVKVRSGETGVWLESERMRWVEPTMRLRWLTEKVQAANVVIGVRPEDIVVGSGGIPAHVAFAEPMGFETVVNLVAAGEPIKARVPGTPHFAVGHAIEIGLRVDKLHVFDSTTGDRLGD